MKAQQVRLEDKWENHTGRRHAWKVFFQSIARPRSDLSFISFVYPLPLPEETYKPFSRSHVVLPQMIHPQKGPPEDKEVSRQGLTRSFDLASLGKSSQGPISVL